jgi:gliding motility-associated-like protein
MASYSWTGPNGFTSNQQSPQVSPSATLAMAGVYTLTVVDGNGCTNSANTTVVVNALPVVTASSNSPVCVGSPLNLTGGPAGMASYSWTGPNGFTSSQQSPQVSPSATLAMAGVYTLTVIDGNGCTNSANTTVVVNSLPSPTASSNSPVCEGDILNLACLPNGMASYSWSGPNGFTSNIQNPTVSANATLAMAGLYTVTVTDIAGCSNTASTTVIVTAAPIADAGPNDSICFGDTLFITDASASNYSSLLWTSSSGYNGFNDNSILNPYYVPGSTDQANGQVTLYLMAFGTGPCGFAIDSMILRLPSQIQVSVGSISPFVIGANTDIEICMTYEDHLVVQDLSYFLQAPDGMTIIPLKEVENPGGMCNFFGGPGSSVDLCFITELTPDDTMILCDPGFWKDISGTYAATGDWSNFYGQNPADGGWSIIILDYLATEGSGNPDGYLTHASISFIDTSIFTHELTTIQFESGVVNIPMIEGDGFTPGGVTYAVPLGLRTSCAGTCDALAMVTVTGGTPPYLIYDWDDPLVPDEDSVFLCEGIYTITVTDAMGCTGSTSITVISPPAIVFDDINYTDTLDCYGDSNGFISVQASGGTGSLTYTLLPDIPSETADSGYFSGLSAGMYTIHVEDAMGCYHDTTLMIVQPSELILESAVVTDSVFCSGETNGRIEATASGGTPPYTFILEPSGISNNTGIFTNLGPGSYVVRLTDANNCDTINSDTLILGVPIPLIIDTVIVTPILCHGETGTMTVVVAGGRPPYDVFVNGAPEQSGITDTAIIVRGPGNWDISVTDANACTASWPTIAFTDPSAMVIDSLITTPITTCYTDPVGEIAIYVSGGTGSIEYSLNGIIYQSSNLFTGLTGGPHIVFYRDANGCVETTIAVIPSPPLLLGNPTVTDVEGDSLGSILLNPTGGTPFPPPDEYRYSIDGGPLTTNPLFEDLTPGTYLVHVEDANGCPWDSLITIVVLDLNVTITVIDADCYGEPLGEIRIRMNDGTPPYTIYYAELGNPLEVWYTGMDNFRTIPSVFPGVYIIRVVDFNSRRFEDTVTVSSPDPLSYSISTDQVSCHEYTLTGGAPNDGSITINNVSGGTGNYAYTWSDIGVGGPQRQNLTAGLYIFTISDENGCSLIDSIELVGQDTIYAQIFLDLNEPDRNLTGSELSNYPVSGSDTLCYLSNWLLFATYNHPESPYETLEWIPDTVLDDPNDFDQTDVSITMKYPLSIRLTITRGQCMDFDLINLYMFDTIGMHIETDAYRIADSIYDPLGKPLNLFSTDSFAAYLWLATDEFEDNELQNVILAPFRDQEVIAIGTTFDRCYESDTVFVVIQQPLGEIFDVFTPNDDGYNDYWNIPNALQYPDLEVIIFDRWGQQVFYSKPYGIDPYHTWDGKSQKNGKDLPIGSYYYIIKPNDGEHKPISGTVTIVR